MIARAAAAASLAMACNALAQHPSPPPAFAPSNLSPAGVRAMAADCAPCHGTDGHAAPGSVVSGLAGKPRGEIVRAMALFREGKRPATVMHQIAKGFTEAEVEALDDYFSRLKPR